MNLRHVVLLVLLPVLVIAWDIAVVLEDEIQFLQEGKLIGTASDSLRELLSTTYDPVRGDLYVSDCNQPNASIFRVNMLSSLQSSTADTGFKPVVLKQPTVQGITFDPVSSTLFWTTGLGRTIGKLPLGEQSDNSQLPSVGIVMHKFIDEIPQGIAVDSCTQQLYWTNCNHLKPSIEMSAIDGSNKRKIIEDRLFQPLGIVVDQELRKIYWSDEREGMYYSIERSNLDGSSRETLIHGTHHQPFAITVSMDRVYWSDWVNNAIWSMPKDNVQGGVEPVVLRTFRQKSPLGVMSNVARIKFSEESCPVMALLMKQIEDNESKWKVATFKPSTKASLNQSSSDLTLRCLNNGTVTENGSCRCPAGFTGPVCQYSACYNYCLDGTCALNAKGQPICRCSSSRRRGARCELDTCSDVCMNDGVCSVSNTGQVTCKCKAGFTGNRCQFESNIMEELCLGYCGYVSTLTSNEKERILPAEPNGTLFGVCSCLQRGDAYYSHDVPIITGSKLEQTTSEYSPTNSNAVLAILLSILCVVLVLLVVALVFRVYKLRRGPRIRKRIIVNRPSPPCAIRNPSDHCEITIENCCNMNICEAPCFEPDFRSSRATFNKSKADDKKSLITNSKQSLTSQEDESF